MRVVEKEFSRETEDLSACIPTLRPVERHTGGEVRPLQPRQVVLQLEIADVDAIPVPFHFLVGNQGMKDVFAQGFTYQLTCLELSDSLFQ